MPSRREATGAGVTVNTVGAPDGVPIRYEAGGHGEPALVFVHGWSCDRSYWRAQVDHFARSRRVAALDLGGHGESGLGRNDWTITAFAGDVRAVVEALGEREVVLVGHSMGGAVIVETARLIPGRVAALLPVDFFNDVDRAAGDEEIRREAAAMRAGFRPATEAMVRAYFPPGTDPGVVEWVSRDMASAPPDVAICALGHTRRYNQGAGLAAVRTPMRLINSDFWPTDLDAARRHKADATLAIMPGVGHFPMLEKPVDFNRLLERAVVDLIDGGRQNARGIAAPGRGPAGRG